MEPPTIFLSYSRVDLDDVALLARVLRVHGIRTWQDVKNLGSGLSENRIRSAIRDETSGLLFYSTRHSVSSEFIKNVELTEAQTAYRSDSDYIILPVFRLSTKDTDAALEDSLTIPLSSFNGVIVGRIRGLPTIQAAAHRAAELILPRLTLDEQVPLPIGLSSKQAPSGGVALDIDFAPFFESGFPTEEDWNTTFPRALNAVKDALVKRTLIRLRVRAFAHLSLGFLFGFVFREPTDFLVEIEQKSRDFGTTIWGSAGEALPHKLRVSDYPGVLDSRDLCVKINLVARDDTSTESFSAVAGLRYRGVIEVTPPEYPHFITGGEGITIARDLADKIKELHGKYRTTSVHLFAAVPIGLAILIGHYLNACGAIHCYEFDSGSREYRSSCVLQG